MFPKRNNIIEFNSSNTSQARWFGSRLQSATYSDFRESKAPIFWRLPQYKIQIKNVIKFSVVKMTNSAESQLFPECRASIICTACCFISESAQPKKGYHHVIVDVLL